MWPAWPRLRFPVRRASWPTSLQALSSLEWLGIVASGEWRVAREEKFQSAPGDEAGRNAQGEDHTPLITHHSPLITRHYSEPLATIPSHSPLFRATHDSSRVSRGKLCRSPRPRKG